METPKSPSEFNEESFLAAHGELVEKDYDEWADEWLESSPYIHSPYTVHVAGPDDVFPARTWREAVALAHQMNAGTIAYSRRTKNDGMVRSWATPYLTSDAVAAGIVRGAE